MNRDNTGQVVWKVIFSHCIFFFSSKTKTTFVTDKHYIQQPDFYYYFVLFHQALKQRQSHGRLTGYKVTFRSSKGNLQHRSFSPDTSTAPFNLSHMAALGTDKIEATVIAENEDGASLPSRVLIPLCWTGTL